MKVSVIIPTLNGGRYLEELLSGLKRQTVKPSQVLVVDSSSKDDTVNICRSFEGDVVQIDPVTFDHGGTRNLAASRVKGDILVYLSQDTSFNDTGSLENLIRPLREPGVAASYGRQVPRNDANVIERFARSFNYPLARSVKGIEDVPEFGVKAFFFSNVYSAIKRDAFNEVGGFPEKAILSEDMTLAAKLIKRGYKIAYEPDAVVSHSHNFSLTTQFKRYFDIGIFFGRNRWIRDMASSGREGRRYLKEELRFLATNKKWTWIPYALADTVARFLGYRAGLLERAIPGRLKPLLSYNRNFWRVDWN